MALLVTVVVGRIFSDTFAGIASTSAPGCIAAQIVGVAVGLALIRVLSPDASATADDVVVPHSNTSPSPLLMPNR